MIIATRRSKLALAQSQWVRDRLETLHPGLTVSLREYITRGDRIQNVPLPQVGGKGLFTREIEEALLSAEADLAVHSLKDLPSELPSGLTLTAVPEREDARDVLVFPAGASPESGSHPSGSALERLPAGARVGSSSLRRAAQLRHARADLRVESVRGNVDTRLRKLDAGEFDALVLAAAGLHRLGLEHRISARLSVEVSTPAPGQGALGLEARQEDTRTRSLLALLDHPETRGCIAAERAVMTALGGGCSIPLGAYARAERGALHLMAIVARPDGSRVIRESGTGDPADPEALGREVAARLVARGARQILSEV